MRDWEAFVREHLALPELTPEREARIVRELAGQLEDFYRDGLSRGLGESEADAHARRQIHDWRGFASEVRQADRPNVRPYVEQLAERAEEAGHRQGGGWTMFADLMQDLRYALRQLRRSPGFTVVAVLTLALGIGANTAIFSVINGVLLQPLPYPDPERLVLIWSSHPQRGVSRFPVDPADFVDWQAQTTVFEDMGIFKSSAGAVRGSEEPQRILAMSVSPGYFRALGVKPLLGRTFTEEENQSGTSEVAVLSHSFWQNYFGGDPNILSRTFFMDQDHLTVVGVMPADFQSIGGERQIWRPFGNAPHYSGRGSYDVWCVARLKPDVKLEQAQAEMDILAAAVAKENPKLKSGVEALVDSLPDIAVRGVRTALLILWGIVGLILLIACANVAGLVLAQATTRQRELAIRFSLGAGRGRLVRQLLTESLLLSLFGGAAGCLLAAWSIRVLPALSAGRIPRIDEVTVDNVALFFTLGLSVLTGILAGFFPAFRATRSNVQEELKEGGRTATPTRQRMRSALVMAEFALTIIVLVGAGLLIRSYVKVLQESPGFDAENLMTFRLEPVRITQYSDSASPEEYRQKYAGEREKMNQFYGQLLEGIRSVPGVRSAAAISQLPLQGTSWAVLITFEGRPPPESAREAPAAQARVVTPGYFQTMRIPLLRGRVFTELDHAGTTRVAVIDETMARMHWPDEDPIGKRITTEDPENSAWLTIAGVVGDVRPVSLEAPPQPTLYVPFAQSRLGFGRSWKMNVVARAEDNPLALVPAFRTLVRNQDRDLPISNLSTMEETLADSLAVRRFNLMLVGLFAGVAVVLAVVGVYGMISYMVSQRVHEIGVRIALGARPEDILRWVLRRGFGLALIGCLLGIVGALALTRLMESLLFSVRATDPLTFAGIPFLLLSVTFLACWVPARRAARVDPMVALRHE